MSILDVDDEQRGPIAWMVRNPLIPNILLTVLLVGGILIARQTKQEIWPERTSGAIAVQVEYPGAGPDEVEQDILLAIENSVQGIEGIKSVDTHGHEGLGTAELRLLPNANAIKVLQDVTYAINSIQTFPAQVERPQIDFVQSKEQALSLIVTGKQSYQALRALAERVRDELRPQVGGSTVAISLAAPYEISIEIPLAKLRAYKLTLDRIAGTLRDANVNIPGGEVLASSGRVLLRTRDRKEQGKDFADIPIVTTADGAVVRLGDIAEIKDGFQEGDGEAQFNERPAIAVDIYRDRSFSSQSLSKIVRSYIDTLTPELPPNTRIEVWNDTAEVYAERFTVLRHDALWGLLLLLVILGLFVELRVAFLITLCVPVSLFGAFFLLQFTPVSLNMVSIFSLIIMLGITIDAAVTVGESIYRKREQGEPLFHAACQGAHEVVRPLFFSLCATGVLFLPMFLFEGELRALFIQIAIVALAVLLLVLVQVLFILPSHLSVKPREYHLLDVLNRPKLFFYPYFDVVAEWINNLIVFCAFRHRYSVLSVGVVFLLLSGWFVVRGTLPVVFFPKADTNIVTFQAELPFGAPLEEARKVREAIVNGAHAAQQESASPLIRGIYSLIGAPLTLGFSAGTHLVGASVNLVSPYKRSLSSTEFAHLWRKQVGNIPEAKKVVVVDSDSSDQSAPIELRLSHPVSEQLEAAAKELFHLLGRYRGVVDVSNNFQKGKQLLDFQLTTHARSLGLSPSDLGMQIRSAFYGTEALRQLRGKNMVKVMLRLPKAERSSLDTLHSMVIFTPFGAEVPLSEAAKITEQSSSMEIQRYNGQRVVSLSANIDPEKTSVSQIVDVLNDGPLPVLMNKYPGLSYQLNEEREQHQALIGTLQSGSVLVLIALYALIAFPLKNWIQPLIVLGSLPFIIVGAMGGHILLGYSVSVMSVFGIVALTGVVMNSAMIMIAEVNKFRREDRTLYDAIRMTVILRCRPVMMSSVGTFLCVSPLLFESHIQAKSLVPMAISLGFGVLFTMTISLLLVPALYVILEDAIRLFQRYRGRVGG